MNNPTLNDRNEIARTTLHRERERFAREIEHTAEYAAAVHNKLISLIIDIKNSDAEELTAACTNIEVLAAELHLRSEVNSVRCLILRALE